MQHPHLNIKSACKNTLMTMRQSSYLQHTFINLLGAGANVPIACKDTACTHYVEDSLSWKSHDKYLKPVRK